MPLAPFLRMHSFTYYFLLLDFPGILQSRADIVQDSFKTALDGKPVDLSCTHSSATTETIFWYRQFPNQGPQYIASGYSGVVKSTTLDGSLHISSDRKSNRFAFTKVTLEDSAVYYCALSDTVLHPGRFAVQ
uniref:Ig-like domain-containing protein n=1 Tax=Anolis carolinensis TaxID=28377 RepID=A0A803U0K2_ANOCA